MTLRQIVSWKPLHLALLPALFIAKHFFTITSPSANWFTGIVLNLAGALVLCIFLPWIVYWILCRWINSVNSAVVATTVCIPFFFLQDFLVSIDTLDFAVVRARWTIPVIGIALGVFCFRVIAARRPRMMINQFLNVLIGILLLYTVVEVVIAGTRRRPPSANALVQEPVKFSCSECPNIYLLILDSYTSNKSLRTYFNFDNREFVKRLEKLDFAVADEMKSGYTETMYSMAATLNVNSIPKLDQYRVGIDGLIDQSAMTEGLRKLNYKIYNFSIFRLAGQDPYYAITPNIPIQFLNGIVQSSSLNILVYDVILKNTLYGTTTEVLAEMEAVARDAPPRKFAYGHVMAPHPPFTIDSAGNSISIVRQGKNRLNRDGYVAQVQGLNKLTLQAVSEIVSADPEAVIVIAGDHGYRYLEQALVPKESYTVFLAYRGPGKDQVAQLPSSNDIFTLLFDHFPL